MRVLGGHVWLTGRRGCCWHCPPTAGTWKWTPWIPALPKEIFIFQEFIVTFSGMYALEYPSEQSEKSPRKRGGTSKLINHLPCPATIFQTWHDLFFLSTQSEVQTSAIWVFGEISKDVARWTPTSYKWIYNPYKWHYTWVTGCRNWSQKLLKFPQKYGRWTAVDRLKGL